MLNLVTVFDAVLLLSLPCTAGEVQESPLTRRPDVDLVELLRKEGATGFSGVVMVFHDGEELVREAFSTDSSLTLDSGFWIGSLTKPITAAAILRLKEMERLSLSDTLADLFPETPADKRRITLHDLLTHTSGLPHAYRADGIAERDEAVAAILALPLAGEPGQFRYSNDGYSLLAAVIEIASEETYEEFVRREVFARAGMEHSGFWPVGRNAPAPTGVPPDVAAGPSWGHRGATGIYSTATDLRRFQEAFLSGRIISPDSVALAISEKVSGEDPSYGYGWFILAEGGRQVFHSGAESELRHFAWLRWFPETRTSIVLVSNSPRDVASGVSRRLVDAVRVLK